MALHTTLSLEELVEINTSVKPVVPASNLNDALANRVFSQKHFVDASGRNNFQRQSAYLIAKHPQQQLLMNVNLFDPNVLIQYIQEMLKVGVAECFEPDGKLKSFLQIAIGKYFEFDPTDLNAKKTILRQYLFAMVDMMAEKIASDEFFKPLLTTVVAHDEQKTSEAQLRDEVRAYVSLVDILIANVLGMPPRNLKKFLPAYNTAYRRATLSFAHDSRDFVITPDMCQDAVKKGVKEMAIKNSLSTILPTLDWWPIQFAFAQLREVLKLQFQQLPKPVQNMQSVVAILDAATPQLRWLDSAILATHSAQEHPDASAQIKFAAQYKAFAEILEDLMATCSPAYPQESVSHQDQMLAVEAFRSSLSTDMAPRVDLGGKLLLHLQLAQVKAIEYRSQMLAELDSITPKPNWLEDKSVLMYFSQVKAWAIKRQFTSDISVDLLPHIKAALNLFLTPHIEALNEITLITQLNLCGQGLLASPPDEKDSLPLVRSLAKERIKQLTRAFASLTGEPEHGSTAKKSHTSAFPQLNHKPLPDSALKSFSLLGAASLSAPKSFADNVQILRCSHLFERVKSCLERELASLTESQTTPTKEMHQAWEMVTQTSSKSPEQLLLEVFSFLTKATELDPFLQRLHSDIQSSLIPNSLARAATPSHRGSLKELAMARRAALTQVTEPDAVVTATSTTGVKTKENLDPHAENEWDPSSRRRSDALSILSPKFTADTATTDALLAWTRTHDRTQSAVDSPTFPSAKTLDLFDVPVMTDTVAQPSDTSADQPNTTEGLPVISVTVALS